jgi:hypothetical protein
VSYISQHQPDLRPLSSRHHRSDHQVGHGVTTRHSHTLFQLLHSLLPVRLMLHDETTISFDHQVHERLTYSLALSWMIRSTNGSSSAQRSLAHSIFSRHSLKRCRSQLATRNQLDRINRSTKLTLNQLRARIGIIKRQQPIRVTPVIIHKRLDTLSPKGDERHGLSIKKHSFTRSSFLLTKNGDFRVGR